MFNKYRITVLLICLSVIFLVRFYYENKTSRLISNFYETYEVQQRITNNCHNAVSEISACINQGEGCDARDTSEKLESIYTEKAKLDNKLTELKSNTQSLLLKSRITKQCKDSTECDEGKCVSFEKQKLGQQSDGTCVNFVPIRGCYNIVENGQVTNSLCSD